MLRPFRGSAAIGLLLIPGIFSLLILSALVPFVVRTVSAQDITADKSIEYWLQQLESDSYAERQTASHQLETIGVEAIRPMVERMLGGPPESVMRCSRLLSSVAMRSSEKDMTRIARVLLLLSENGFSHLRDESYFLNAKWKQAQVSRNVETLKKAGIKAEPFPGYGDMQVELQMFAAITGDHMVAKTPGSETEKVEEPDSLVAKLDDTSVLISVDDILAANDDENNRMLQKELAADATQSQTSNPVGNTGQASSGIIIVDGEALVLTRGMPGRSVFGNDSQASTAMGTPFMVTIDDKFDGDLEKLQLLSLLPSVQQLTVADRKLDQEMLDVIGNLESLQALNIQRCFYDAGIVLQLMKRKPLLSVNATGHDAFLGVQLQTDVKESGETFCSVLEVVAGTAAEEAGCKAGDTILSLNDVKVATYEQLILTIASYKPGDQVTMDVLRDEKESLTITATLRDRPADQ